MFQSAPDLIHRAITRQRIAPGGLTLPVNEEVAGKITLREQRCLVQQFPLKGEVSNQ